ncbi:alpha/beta fold family hydrolase [Nitzschia inconspicua]|uniref:Alpha/beta fold family hydrolase n=1 Tax=Nitzschia inconspicua TaxID=303405 RepID=A0A9K3KZA5_9STRA|nr:alpha/beta fold family hydrolase [Nitzschia inconspicua]
MVFLLSFSFLPQTTPFLSLPTTVTTGQVQHNRHRLAYQAPKITLAQYHEVASIDEAPFVTQPNEKTAPKSNTEQDGHSSVNPLQSLVNQQDFAHRIVKTFEPRKFRPASKLLANRHVQTISGSLLRDDITCRYVNPKKTVVYSPPWIDPGINILTSSLLRKLQAYGKEHSTAAATSSYWDTRERFDTPDHDFFDVDFKYADSITTDVARASPKGIVIVVPGLQSNSNSSLVREMAQACVARGFDAAAINFRGCSGTPNEGLRAYHLGFTDDLKQLIGIIHDRLTKNNPLTENATTFSKKTPPIFLSGKSLGANVVLKALGELGDTVHEYNIQGAAVYCCPFDNQRNVNFLLQGLSKVVYNGNLLQSLKSMALSQFERFADTPTAHLVDLELLQSCTTITEFDEAFTVPLFGFDDHLDYYNQTSCLNFLDRIQVPTLICNARDDPFMDPVYYPWDFHCDSLAGKSRKSPIRIVRSDHGGHLGYMFHDDEEDGFRDVVSFLPSELGRFLDHVLECTEAAEDSMLSFNKDSRDVFPTTETSSGAVERSQVRRKAFELSSSFRANEFKPPRILTNEHLQTISGVFLRHDPSCRYVANGIGVDVAFQKGLKLLSAIPRQSDVFGDFWDRRQRIDTPDGDFFHVDYKYHSDYHPNDPSSKGIVVIVHGLQSSSNSSLSVDLGRAFSNQGFDVACINFRGCSGEPNNSLRAYHLGFTDDLIHLLRILNSGQLKPPPIFLSGFSLGANVVLKALGELGDNAFTSYGIYGAAVAGAPFDNERNIKFVQKPGFNKIAYNDSLLKNLKVTCLRQLERHSRSKEAKTLSHDEIVVASEISALESAFISPLFGFRDNVDYYRKTNCIDFLDNIEVPTLILNAADDPFFDPSFFPWEKGCDSPIGQKNLSPIKLVRTKHGGHLGFMFHQRSKEDRYLQAKEGVSFMPSELARFVTHVFDRRAGLDETKTINV